MAALAAVLAAEVEMPFPSAGLSLLDRILDLETLIETVAVLDEDDLSPELRADYERDLAAAISGTREKVDRTASVLAALEASAAAAAKEAARLTERKQRFERQRERLARYVVSVLEVTGQKKLEGTTATLTARLNPVAVEIAPDAVLPAEFLRVPPPPAAVPDKTAIKAALAAGADVPGCRLTRSARLVIS